MTSSAVYADSFATCILDAKYKQVNIHDVAFDQCNLLLDQQQYLFTVLLKHKKISDGSLGVYPHKKVHIDLKLGAKPLHHPAYPVPHVLVENVPDMTRICPWDRDMS